ncbi:caspase family protein [Clostridium perfringens]|nr:caspase family protein [Clostridium perfringens]
MSDEIRYAIVIGINDYENRPLNFCANDARSIKESLIKNCRFKNENIYEIISCETSTKKDITGLFLEALRKIKSKFREEKDSILFYFAGHGGYNEDKSVLYFQDITYPIEEVFLNIAPIKPKIQTYIIDACHSGGKVLTRANSEADIDKYIKNSNGVMFLYACQKHEFAYEKPDIQHGDLTHSFLEALENKSLYDEGILTFNRIVDEVQKSISQSSGFKQIPVIENSVTGYYPFAIDYSKKIEKINGEDNMKLIDRNENDAKEIVCIDAAKSKEDYITLNKEKIMNIRKKIFDKLNKKFEEDLDKYEVEDMEKYNVSYFNDFNFLDSKNIISSSLLEKEIVTYVEESKLIPLNNLIYSEEKQVIPSTNPFSNILASINLYNNIKQEKKDYIINFINDNIKSKFKLFVSEDIMKVCFSIGYICYQAKWGVVGLKITFFIDWDGEEFTEIKDIKIENVSFMMKEESINDIDFINLGIKEFVDDSISSWEKQRKDELEVFNNH